jgi:hypothetical protein
MSWCVQHHRGVDYRRNVVRPTLAVMLERVMLGVWSL